MKITCPHCNQNYDIDKTSIGKEADCTSCGNHFVIQATVSKPLKSVELSHCPYCAGELVPGVKKCRHCGEWVNTSDKPKSSIIYFLMALFFGMIGVHNFYALQISYGVEKILLTLMAWRIVWVWPHLPLGYLIFCGIWIWIIAEMILFCQKGVIAGKQNVKKEQILLCVTVFLLIACIVYSIHYEAVIDSTYTAFELIDSGGCTVEEACRRRDKALSLPGADFDKIMQKTREIFENSDGQKRLRSYLQSQGLSNGENR